MGPRYDVTDVTPPVSPVGMAWQARDVSQMRPTEGLYLGQQGDSHALPMINPTEPAMQRHLRHLSVSLYPWALRRYTWATSVAVVTVRPLSHRIYTMKHEGTAIILLAETYGHQRQRGDILASTHFVQQ
jgi:hypothetical protein